MRPFRFGFTGGASSKRTKLLDSARTVEALGYSTFGLADHFVRPFAPLIAGQAVADATTTLRVTQTVLAQDFRSPPCWPRNWPPSTCSPEGRLQVGLGAGLAAPGVRGRRHALRPGAGSHRAARGDGHHPEGPLRRRTVHFSGEHYTVTALEGRPAPVQRPRPPIMIGGGGRKVLSVAARHADIVQLMPSNRGGRDVARPVAVLRARDRGEDRLDPRGRRGPLRRDRAQCPAPRMRGHRAARASTSPTWPTASPASIERMGGGRIDLGEEDLRRSPIVAVGSLDDVCETLVETRARYGISYFAAPIDAPPDVLAPVIERLAGE